MLGERLRMFRRRSGMTQSDVAELLNVSRPAVGQWEAGKTMPSLDALNTLAQHFSTSRSVLLGDEAETNFDKNISPIPKMKNMAPLISWVQAGSFSESHVELDENTVYYPRPTGCSENTFVLRVVGESMIDEYKPGTLVFVDPERAAVSGDDVIAVMTDTGEATLKRYIEEPGMGKMLKSMNSNWPDPYLSINGNCHITGVVIAAMWLK